MDSDDYISPETLGGIKKEIASNNPDIAYFGYYYEENEKSELLYPYKSKAEFYAGEDFFKSELRQKNLPIPACMACYRRKFILQNNLWFKEGILHEDVRWSPIVVSRARSVLASQTALYHYVIRKSSISQQENREKNGKDLIDTCHYLAGCANEIADNETRRYFENYVATAYLKAVAVNNIAFNGCAQIDRRFPLRYAFFQKDIIRSMLFLFSPGLYTKTYMWMKTRLLNSKM